MFWIESPNWKLYVGTSPPISLKEVAHAHHGDIAGPSRFQRIDFGTESDNDSEQMKGSRPILIRMTNQAFKPTNTESYQFIMCAANPL